MSVAVDKPSAAIHSTPTEVGPGAEMEFATVKTSNKKGANPGGSLSGKAIALSIVDPSESKLEPGSQSMVSSLQSQSVLATTESKTLHKDTALTDETDTVPPLPNTSSS